MRIEWLEDLMAIYESDSLNEAAARRHVTQPAFSRRVRAIEDYLGVTLLERTRKPARPTAALMRQEDRVRDVTRAMRLLILELKRRREDASNQVVMAGQHAITTSILPDLIARDFARFQVNIRLRSANRSECLAMLVERTADITLTYKSNAELIAPREAFVEEVVVARDRLVPVAAPGMVETCGAMRPLPFVAYPEDVFFGELVRDAIRPRCGPEVALDLKVETALTLAALQLASASVGMAWVPLSTASAMLAAGQVVDLSDRLPTEELAVIATRLREEPQASAETVWQALCGSSARRDERTFPACSGGPSDTEPKLL
ncbi:LysR family transcriptional regulator [Acuticoccus sediminis]|uniref:LysR family transcriptional regulator n=1 Tax=Acuticoccus sediminis TaxID=2184697 RepID=UPI001CFEFA48|nr:LysR family transcriptional regulator [Acuticoccus sediminis]